MTTLRKAAERSTTLRETFSLTEGNYSKKTGQETRQTEECTYRDRKTHRHTDIQKGRHANKEKGRKTNTQTDRV